MSFPDTARKQWEDERTVDSVVSNECGNAVAAAAVGNKRRRKQRLIPSDMDPCFCYWNHGDGKNYIRCNTCYDNEGVVKMFSSSTQPPPITRKTGTQYRSKVIEAHVKSAYHIAATEAAAAKAASKEKPTGAVERLISKSQEKLANHIGRLAMTIFVDAKKLTLSAYSWPARMVAYEYGAAFNINEPEQTASKIQKVSLQYMNPMAHSEILKCIVAVEENLLSKKIEDCIALSLRADGSVDRTNLDKIYVLAKIINREGELETLFLGVGAQSQRGATGLFNAIQEIINAAGEDLFLKVVHKMSSIVTDGASVNIGERSGLWKLIDDYAKEHKVLQNIMKIWCAAHRSDLSVKDLKKAVKELPYILGYLKKLSSFIRKSSMRFASLCEVNIGWVRNFVAFFGVNSKQFYSYFKCCLLNQICTTLLNICT